MKIIFNDIKIFAHHGWYDEEQQTGHWFMVDVLIELTEIENINDSLDNTFNYELVYKIVKEEMATTQKLLETVVQNILQKIMKHKVVKNATVRLNKLEPYKMQGVGKVAVELTQHC
jgi:7,8-dihydroneopterin aldolase/epimerase/oxygenase